MSETVDIKLHHVAISVPCIEDSIIWYREKLGLHEVMRTQIPGTDVKIAFVGNSVFQVEIFEVPGANPLPDGRSYPNTDFRTHGVKHFCIMVSNAREFVEQLKTKGVEVVLEPKGMPSYAAFINDIAGNIIEIFDCAEH
jgi:methylmalonyl-CoA/ethylmalonyl-CoA epimerase